MEFLTCTHATPSGPPSRLKNKVKSERIKTFLRIRPLNKAENLRGSHVVVECASNCKEVTVNERPVDKITRKFAFDRVFLPESKQIDVYKGVAAPLIKEVLDGYNCTIFAYGQTGSGKTYTMEGEATTNQSKSWNADSHAGIIPRAVGHLFDELRLLNVEYSVRASFLEIYNEELFDLLSPVDDTNKLRLYEDTVRKGAVVVNGLDEVVVRSREEVYSILEKGSRKRQTAATLMNASSSRSHSVFSITVRIKENGVNDCEELVRTGKLNLVDLAGSENIGRSGAVEKRAREAGNINQSLLTLGRVITALVEKTPHIPYRESKLTRLLQESLGGRTKTCIIGTISPSQCSVEETLSTLDYAHRAKNIQNKPEINQKIGKTALIQEYAEEIERLKSDLIASRQKNGVYLAEENYNEMLLQIDSQKRELSVLIGDVKSVTETLERKEELNRELHEALQKYMEELCKSQISHQKSEFLLNHHMGTEEKLFKQAESLLSVADTATNHVNLLHESLGRRRIVEVNNLTACQNLSSKSQNQLSKLKEMAVCFQESRIKSNNEILKIVGEGQEFTKARTKEMKDNADLALETSMMLISRVLECSKNMASQTGLTVDSAKLNAVESSHQISGEILGLLQCLLGRVNQITKTISEFQSEHQKNVEDLSDKIEEQEVHLQHFLNSASLHVDEVNKKKEIEKTILQNTADNLKKQKEHMSKEVGAALRTLQNMFQCNENVLSVGVGDLERSLSTVESATDSMKSMESEINNMKNYSDSYKKSISSLLNTNRGMASPVVNEIKCVSSGITEEINAHKLRIPELQKESTNTIVKNFDSVSSTVSQFVSDQNCAIQDLCNHASKLTKTQNEIFKKTEQECSEIDEKCENFLTQDTAYLNDWIEVVTKKISGCESMIQECVTKEILEDKPSGKTPQRQEYSYPRDLASTSPHERILSRFQFERVGDSLMESFSGQSTSLSENMINPSNNLQYQSGQRESKSTSNICDATSTMSLPCKSESNISSMVFDKENSPLIFQVPGLKLPVSKRNVLSEHNE